MKTLLGFLLALALFSQACNSDSQPQQDSESAVNELAEPAAQVTEAMAGEVADLKEELQDVHSMLKTHMEQLDESIAQADETAKEAFVEKKKQVQSWSNKINLQLQRLDGDMTANFSDFKVNTEKLFDDIETFFKEDVSEPVQ